MEDVSGVAGGVMISRPDLSTKIELEVIRMLYTCLICGKHEWDVRSYGEGDPLVVMKEHLSSHGISPQDLQDPGQQEVAAQHPSLVWVLSEERATALGLLGTSVLHASREESHLFCQAAIFPDALHAGRACEAIRHVLFLHQAHYLAACHVRHQEVWYVLVVGSDPRPGVQRQLERILSQGEPVLAPAALLLRLVLRALPGASDDSVQGRDVAGSDPGMQPSDKKEGSGEEKAPAVYQLSVRVEGSALHERTRVALSRLLARRAVGEIQDLSDTLFAQYAREKEATWTFGELRQHFPAVPVSLQKHHSSLPLDIFPPCTCYLAQMAAEGPYYGNIEACARHASGSV